jgi:hypothetical protein
MFRDKDLEKHLQTASTVKSQTAVIAEWNMNFFENIADIGNYRHRPLLGIGEKYGALPNFYDPRDIGNFYTNATQADVVIDGGLESDAVTPALFTEVKEKEKLLFSLEDCFAKFRPRSGINKLRYGITGKYLHHSGTDMFNRPRYYMPDKNDKFKYWTSYRTEGGKEYGIANNTLNEQFHIEDAVPYVVYKEEIPVNRIVIKTQTNVGDINLGPFSGPSGTFADPFFGEQNKTTPVKWKLQYLKNNDWIDAISFDKASVRNNGEPIFSSNGYVEIGYGLIVPEIFRANFLNNGVVASTTVIPLSNEDGQAYLVREDENSLGTYYIWFNGEYRQFAPKYDWYVVDENVDQLTNFVTDATNPKRYTAGQLGATEYEEFVFISGIRIVVDTMNKIGSTFDLIELSPRLTVDITEKTVSYSINKSSSDLGVSGLPVGQLLASTGQLTLFDYDQAFDPNNAWDPETGTGSLISKYINKNIQIKLYEVISDVEVLNESGNKIKKSFYVPLKTLYSESFPQSNLKTRQLDIPLRDLFFHFESQLAPELLIPNASLSYILALLFDSIGFSNYSFKRVLGETDPIIPYFFIAPGVNIAEVLQDLARATQTAMYFDEYNNFIMMSKNYTLPSNNERDLDITLVGANNDPPVEIVDPNQIIEKRVLENIIDISSVDNDVYNDGKISYVARYIKREMGSIKQAYQADKNVSWIYSPALLWEVAGTENLKPRNGETSTGERYALAAIPLNSDLSSLVPRVENHELVNNIIDFGDGILYIGRYSGYFYSSGEIIEYDAVEYNVSVLPSSVLNSGFTGGNVWISSPKEYEDYFSKLSFNGKIYPTGRVRIYAEPSYETFNGITRMSNGEVAKHGRGQFGTEITEHKAGLNQHWSDNNNVYGCSMKSKYLFGDSSFGGQTGVGKAGVNKPLATRSSRSGLIKNFLGFSYNEEDSRKNKLSSSSETVQSSALSFNGPAFSAQESPIDFISYVSKPLEGSFKHFGTRMRVIGKIENNNKSVQTAAGATTYYNVTNKSSDSSPTVSGGGGGIAALLNPETNSGYYFEIAALSESNVDKYATADGVSNVFFYKLMENQSYDHRVTSNLVGSYSSNQLSSATNLSLGLSIDGVKTGDRVLLTNQKNPVTNVPKPEENGYYSVTSAGGSNIPITVTGPKSFTVPILTNNTLPAYVSGGSVIEYLSKEKGVAISGITKDALIITYTTAENHGLSTGDFAVVSGVNPANYNIAQPSKWVLTKDEEAIPVKLWSGLSTIVVDNGNFAGQARVVAEEIATVYDLALEYEDFASGVRRFYLYLNDSQIATVDDPNPITPLINANNVGLFVRGSSSCMFENVYALSNNYSKNSNFALEPVANSVFTNKTNINASESFRKYAINGIVQPTYLSGISASEGPKYKIFYEEFGTIMREAAYFNIKYDKAYPALYAMISPNVNNVRGYTVSGFFAGAYGAEFLIFNATDTFLFMDETVGNYLRIQGITFTQDSKHELTVDEYFNKRSDFSDPIIREDNTILSPNKQKELFDDIKNSRITYGKNEFSIDSSYIQSNDDATNLMEWLISKIMKPRKSVGVSIFANPTIQLGDLVSIDYSKKDATLFIDPSKKFVVYSIEYKKDGQGPNMTVYLSEV